MIKEALGISDISVLMGANLAKEVAREMFGEATIGKTAETGDNCWSCGPLASITDFNLLLIYGLHVLTFSETIQLAAEHRDLR